MVPDRNTHAKAQRRKERREGFLLCFRLRLSLRVRAVAWDPNKKFVYNSEAPDSIITDSDQHVDDDISAPASQPAALARSVAARLHFLRHHCRGCSPAREPPERIKSRDLFRRRS